MKMKMNKREKNNIILIISSFFIGLIVSFIIMNIFLPKEVGNTYNNSLTKTIEKVEDGVVLIETYTGMAQPSAGSGFIYKKGPLNAYVLTNEHVLEGEKIIVTNSKGQETEGKVLGRDSYLDLAVIEINTSSAPKALTFGDSTKTKVGDSVFAIGSPIGRRYQGSVSSGILSGKDRIVPTKINDKDEWVMKALQFDASINSGNSGGPLFNSKGEVIGICTMKLIEEGIEGMSFALPIEDAEKYLDLLEQGKEIERPELGISMTNISNTLQLINNDITIPDDTMYGAVVLDVKEESSAAKNLQKGDIITQIDDQEIRDTTYVKYVLFQHNKGDKITIYYLRDGKKKSTKITLQ